MVPFWKDLLLWFTICSLSIMSIFCSSYFPFWFRGHGLGSDFCQFLVIVYVLPLHYTHSINGTLFLETNARNK